MYKPGVCSNQECLLTRVSVLSNVFSLSVTQINHNIIHSYHKLFLFQSLLSNLQMRFAPLGSVPDLSKKNSKVQQYSQFLKLPL